MVNSSGNTVFLSMIALLSINVIIALICAGSMSFLFPLFNMIQLICLMPLLEVSLPENLRSFIEEYLHFANFNFNFLFNPIHRWGLIDLTEIINNPLNQNFKENGLLSRVFLVNYGGEMVIWLTIAFAYIPIFICAKLCK